MMYGDEGSHKMTLEVEPFFVAFDGPLDDTARSLAPCGRIHAEITDLCVS